ncbi:MAG TPA: ABC transporter permease [Bacteroidia bacterium]|jgi:lipopolysaccharide transport system permease protein|nr:ABC transporter permease [Bacteroidia bacterium]
MNRTEYEILPEKKFSLGLDELSHFRELIFFFTWRDIKIRYKQTVIGFAWAILQPLLMMFVITFTFGKMMEGKTHLPYPLSIFIGLLLWNVFSSGVTNAGNSMLTNAHIIRKIYFPRLIIPLSSVFGSLFDFLVGLPLLIVMLAWYHFPFHPMNALIGIPSAILLTFLSTFAMGTLLAALTVKYRDFRYIIPFLVQILFFITPVIMPTRIVENNALRFLLSCNPMTSAIELFRCSFNGIWPDPQLLFASISSSLILLVLAFYYFRKTETYFADLA